MKAVIVDLQKGQAAALCDDGRVVKLADAGYALGQIVEVHERKRRTPLWVRCASTAAAAALLLVGAGGGVAYAMPYGVVSLDVNPSLEYTINRFDYVLKVEGVNEDGKELLSQLDTKQLVNRRIGDALETSMQQLEAGDWLGGESDEILIAAGTKQPDHAERLLSRLENALNSRREGLEVRTLAVSEEEISAAHKEGMSAGRHRVLDELKESEGAAFVVGDWADRPIRDILQHLEDGPEGASEAEDAYGIRPAEHSGERTEARPNENQSGQRPESTGDAAPEQPEQPEQRIEQPQNVPSGSRPEQNNSRGEPDSGISRPGGGDTGDSMGTPGRGDGERGMGGGPGSRG